MTLRIVMVVCVFLLLVVSGPAYSEEPLHVKKSGVSPSIDGTADAVWDGIPGTVVKVSPVAKAIVDANKEHQKGKYAKHWQKSAYTDVTEVELKAMYSGDSIFFLARWKDETKDDQHKPWKWEGDRETGEYLAGKEREDRFVMMFPISGSFTDCMLSGSEGVVDVWHWKAARTNNAGIAHDKSHIYSLSEPKGKFSKHYALDGTPVYVSRPGDGGVSPYKSAKVDPFTYQGDFTPKYIPFVPDNADASDVKAKGMWKDGYWTVEMERRLDTGHAGTDAVFDPSKETVMNVAVFNHAGDHFHATSDEIKVLFE